MKKLLIILIILLIPSLLWGFGGTGPWGTGGGIGATNDTQILYNNGGVVGGVNTVKIVDGNINVDKICNEDNDSCVSWPPAGSGDVLATGTFTDGNVMVGNGSTTVKDSGISIGSRGDVFATGTFTNGNVIVGNGSTTAIDSGIALSTLNGDMTQAVYDPTTVAGDAFDADNTAINVIGSPTYTNVQDAIQIGNSAGVIMGCEVTGNDTGTNFNIAACKGFVRTANTHAAPIVSFDLPASSGRAIAAGERRYVSVDYNAGSPTFADATTRSINKHTTFELGEVFRENGTIHPFNNPDLIANGIQHLAERFRHVNGTQVAEGGVLSSSDRTIQISAGEFYSKGNEFKPSAVDTSATSTCDYYLVGGLNDSSATQWDNTNYDAGGILGAISNNRYSFTDVWVDIDSSGNDTCVMVYGTANTVSIAGSQVGAIPINVSTISSRLQMSGVWVGRLIYQQGSSAPSLVEVPATTNVSTGAANSHNDLADVQIAGAGVTNGHIDTSSQTLLGPKIFTDDLEINNDSKGLILKSPDATRWRITIGDDGALTADSL